MLTAESVKEKARQYGADLCGIGDIRYFSDEPPERSPKQILPSAACVIGCAFRIPNGLFQCMEEKRQYMNYLSLGPKFLDEDWAEIFLLRMAAVLENEGWDACVQRKVTNLKARGDKTQNPEIRDTYELIHVTPVAPDKPAPEVILDTALAAKVCGIGTLGLSGSVLTRRFGPRARFVYIITNAPLACDPPMTEELCDHCGACMTACPGHAISESGRDTWQCSVYYRGAHESNPFLTEDFLKDDPKREAILRGDERFDSNSARSVYGKMNFMPDQEGYVPCLCARACDNACWKHLKEAGKLG